MLAGSASLGPTVVTTPAKGYPAVLSFVLYPGEIFVRRLDRERGRWTPCEADIEAKLAARVAEKSLGLIDYFTCVASVSNQAMLARATLEPLAL